MKKKLNELVEEKRTLIETQQTALSLARQCELVGLARSSYYLLLHHLRSIRNIVDYEDTFSGNQLGKTKGALVEAERIIKLLETL